MGGGGTEEFFAALMDVCGMLKDFWVVKDFSWELIDFPGELKDFFTELKNLGGT